MKFEMATCRACTFIYDPKLGHVCTAGLKFNVVGTYSDAVPGIRTETPPRQHLPTDAAARKAIPLATGCVDYFGLALLAVAELSRVGNDQHNPGKPLHWDRSKSGDEADALARHFVDRGTRDADGVRHSTKVAWRALALLVKEIEADGGKL